VSTFKFRGQLALQNDKHQAIMITARASEVLSFASITRAGRDAKGVLQGFQRPQIAAHIREIRDYLRTDDAVLPNCIVVGFVDNIKVRERSDGWMEVLIDASEGASGYVIDGQQRLSALAGLPEKDFRLFVSILICKDYEELRRQFVLLNSTRPLGKALIYELLPGTAGLPNRYSSRSFAAALTERLNFTPDSALQGKIYQHTNPKGIIRDTAIQAVIMRSVSDGAIREYPESKQLAKGYQLLDDFFWAVREVFRDEWNDHTPKSSRLVHGAGIQALGYVMELLVGRDGAQTKEEFKRGLSVLKGHTAWTSGSWRFSDSEEVPWNKLENTSRQINGLAQHLVSIVRRESQKEFKLVAGGTDEEARRRARR
jgi:DGQHR domain-containing protein